MKAFLFFVLLVLVLLNSFTLCRQHLIGGDIKSINPIETKLACFKDNKYVPKKVPYGAKFKSIMIDHKTSIYLENNHLFYSNGYETKKISQKFKLKSGNANLLMSSDYTHLYVTGYISKYGDTSLNVTHSSNPTIILFTVDIISDWAINSKIKIQLSGISDVSSFQQTDLTFLKLWNNDIIFKFKNGTNFFNYRYYLSKYNPKKDIWETMTRSIDADQSNFIQTIQQSDLSLTPDADVLFVGKATSKYLGDNYSNHTGFEFQSIPYSTANDPSTWKVFRYFDIKGKTKYQINDRKCSILNGAKYVIVNKDLIVTSFKCLKSGVYLENSYFYKFTQNNNLNESRFDTGFRYAKYVTNKYEFQEISSAVGLLSWEKSNNQILVRVLNNMYEVFGDYQIDNDDEKKSIYNLRKSDGYLYFDHEKKTFTPAFQIGEVPINHNGGFYTSKNEICLYSATTTVTIFEKKCKNLAINQNNNPDKWECIEEFNDIYVNMVTHQAVSGDSTIKVIEKVDENTYYVAGRFTKIGSVVYNSIVLLKKVNNKWTLNKVGSGVVGKFLTEIDEGKPEGEFQNQVVEITMLKYNPNTKKLYIGSSDMKYCKDKNGDLKQIENLAEYDVEKDTFSHVNTIQSVPSKLFILSSGKLMAFFSSGAFVGHLKDKTQLSIWDSTKKTWSILSYVYEGTNSIGDVFVSNSYLYCKISGASLSGSEARESLVRYNFNTDTWVTLQVSIPKSEVQNSCGYKKKCYFSGQTQSFIIDYYDKLFLSSSDGGIWSYDHNTHFVSNIWIPNVSNGKYFGEENGNIWIYDLSNYGAVTITNAAKQNIIQKIQYLTRGQVGVVNQSSKIKVPILLVTILIGITSLFI